MTKSLKLLCFALLLLGFWAVYMFFTLENEKNGEPLPALAKSFFNRSVCDYLLNKETNDEKIRGRIVHVEDDSIYTKYHKLDCRYVRFKYFAHPRPTAEESEFRIAYLLVAYKSAHLVENLLRAIYMPQNIYCLHLDKKSSKGFKRAVSKVISCLPNVFVTENAVDVIWGHISVLEAELSCMQDLLLRDAHWKYLISLVAQDYPLYSNQGIVQGLKSLGGYNNIQSYPMPQSFAYRADSVWSLQHLEGRGNEHEGYAMHPTGIKKSAPPHNIKIMKGWNHVAATRKFAQFVLYNKTATDFFDWLRDIYIPDEVFFSSLQRHPGTPGGYQGNDNPEWIMRAFHWVSNGDEHTCYGEWKRENCWLSTRDLRWVLSTKNKRKLFTQKIPFEYEENLAGCLAVSVKGRKYPSISRLK